MNKTTYAPSQCDAWTQFSGSLLMVIVYDRDKISSETPLETAIRKFLGTIYPTLGVAGVNRGSRSVLRAGTRTAS
jgi:hypothetical protein